jgi:hypothetical protein
MKLLHVFFGTLVSVIVGSVAVSCGGSTGSAHGGETHWLRSCASNNDCAGTLACLCGVCTTLCNGAGDCASLSPEALCANREDTELSNRCGDDGPAKLCVDDSQLSTPGSGGAGGAPNACDDGNRTFVCDAEDCCVGANIVQFCSAPGESFEDECGCGCLFPEAAQASCDEPGRRYVSRARARCATLLEPCEDSEVFFSDGCGCLEHDAGSGSDPHRLYVDTDPNTCSVVECDELSLRRRAFFDREGCGCEDPSDGAISALVCPRSPNMTCTVPVDCEEVGCSAYDSPFDQNGCLREFCSSNDDCEGAERCLNMYDESVPGSICVPHLSECSDDNGECVCSGGGVCTGYCGITP